MKIMFVFGSIPYQAVAWATVIGTIAAIVIATVFIVESWKYVRALCKRFSLVRRLKKLCRLRGYTFEKLGSLYKSVFSVTEEPEMLITTPEGNYSIKLFTCLRYRDTYTLENATHFTTQSNAGMHLVDFKYPSAGLGSKNKFYMSQFPMIGGGVTVENELDGAEAKRNDDGATKILCLSPVSIEVRRVAKSTTEQVFDGDEIDGHIVYSGDALCRALS